jgi:hypothetical protein
MTTEDAEKFVEKHMLYSHVKGMFLVTAESIHAWVAMKAMNLRDIVNAVLDGVDITVDDVTLKAIEQVKGKNNAN